MAEGSFPWVGIATGDAAGSIWTAPYNDEEYADAWAKVLMSNLARAFVCPGYGNNLKVTVTSPASLGVQVDTGAAYFRGRLYETNAAVSLSLSAADATDPRLDRIVLRLVDANQTIRVAVLEGTAAAAPSLPALTQTAATYEISLAYIYVQAAATSIADTDIHDTREFASGFAQINDMYGNDNLIRNSEFMGFSALSGGATTNPPDRWDLVLTPSNIATAAKPAQMPRSRAVQVTVNAASEGISQTVRVKPSTMYSIRLLVNVTAGDVGSIVVTTNAASPSTITRYIRRTGAWIEELIFYITESDATTLTISLLALNSGDIVSYGQVLCVEGYIPGPFREIHEMIILDEPITDASWDGDAKSTGQTTIDFDADFQALVLPGTQAVQLRIEVRDSGSSGVALQYGLEIIGTIVAGGGPAYTQIQQEPNDAKRTTHGWVGPNSGRQVTFSAIASGVGTLDAWVWVTGIQV